jgi:hypothetical protein
MCEGWLVTICLSEDKWTLLSLLPQLFRTLSICAIPRPSGESRLYGVTEVRRRRTAAGKLQPASVRLA